MTYQIKIPITGEIISDMMVSVCEGGYSGWVKMIDFGDMKYGEGSAFEGNFTFLVVYDREEDDEGDFKGRKKIREIDIKRGLQAFAKECPKGLADLVSENWDALTADCFFQCVVFGKVIYG